MRILVIGASGFIGKACFDHFTRNHETVGFDCMGVASKNLIINADFSVLPLLIADKFDVIINCAGSSNIQESFTDTGKDFWLNVVFVQHVLAAIKKDSPHTKMINISSAAVYGDPKELPVSETAPTNPLSPYGLHKLLSEKTMTEHAHLYQLNTLSVRIFSAYGPGLRRQFFYDLYSKFSSSQGAVELSGTGTESRDFVFISDITSALALLIEKAKFEGEVYNLASGHESSIDATSRMFAEICGYHGEINFNQKQLKGYPINWCADISELRALGFSPEIHLEEGLHRYFNWIKNNRA